MFLRLATILAFSLLGEGWATCPRRCEQQGEQEPPTHPAARQSEALWWCGSLDRFGCSRCSGRTTASERGQIVADRKRAGSGNW